jgi:rhodanese-related sulfurtransferase
VNHLLKLLLQALAIALLGVGLGVLNNLAAGPTRQIEWVRDYPAKGAPLCLDELPATGVPGEGPGFVPPTGEAPYEEPDLAAIDLPEFRPDLPALEITPLQAYKLYQMGALFIDARRTEDYIEGHIPDAISIPIWESGADALIEEVPFVGEDIAIVTYCAGGDCEDSHMLADRLYDRGFLNALVYRDGYPNWVERGWPTHTGDVP